MDEEERPDKMLSPTCEGCGREAEAVIDGKGWCVDCYQARASCCSGEFDRCDDTD